MASTAQQAYNAIKGYMDRQRLPHPRWYVGIAADAKNHMFKEHGVVKETDSWVYDTCVNNAHARVAEDALLKLGCDGDLGVDSTSTDVYAYLKSSHTNP